MRILQGFILYSAVNSNTFTHYRRIVASIPLTIALPCNPLTKLFDLIAELISSVAPYWLGFITRPSNGS